MFNHVRGTYSCSVVICSSAETDDEPPCEEEIDYNTDSCSEEEISELDTLNAEDSLNEEKNGAGKETSPEELSKEDVLPTKLNCSTRKTLPIAPKQYGC